MTLKTINAEAPRARARLTTEVVVENRVGRATLSLKADPFTVCEWVSRRMHPDIDHDAPDPAFDRLMERLGREADEKRLAGRKRHEENLIPRRAA